MHVGRNAFAPASAYVQVGPQYIDGAGLGGVLRGDTSLRIGDDEFGAIGVGLIGSLIDENSNDRKRLIAVGGAARR